MLVREKLKLSDLHRGIKDMKHLPSAVFVIDATHEKIAVSEAKCLGIPTFGLVDTNTDPFMVDYPIPANDDSIKTIQLIMSYITETIHDSIGGNASEANEKESKEEVSDSTPSKENSTEGTVELVEESTSSDADKTSDNTSKD